MDQGYLFGPTALEVEKIFKNHGFGIPEGTHEPCDHIAYEIQFTAEMIKKALENLQLSKEEEAKEYLLESKHFIEKYINPWMKEFLGRIEENSWTEFYQGLARLTKGLLPLQISLLDAVLTEFTDLEDDLQ